MTAQPNPLDFSDQERQPWQALPGTSQEIALDSRANVTFYHGGRGPGKTDVQLMRFYRHVGCGYGRFWRGVIFDREYKMLDDIVMKSRRHFGGWDDGAKFLSNSADYKWVWPTGEELLFRQIAKPGDYWKFHGQEFPFVGWNELTKYPTAELFNAMMSCNRSSFTSEKDAPFDEDGKRATVPPIPLETFATGNPYGSGHGWVKRRFIDPAPSGHVVRQSVKVFNPQTQQDETIELTQVSIFGNYRENKYLSPQYVAQLESESDPNKRRAWLLGDWDIVAGGAFDDVFRREVHVLPRFRVPSTWRLDRAFDWGSSHPSACIWFAEADGTEAILPDGTIFCPPAKSIIAISEVYTHDPQQSNVGLKLSATRIARLIKENEIELMRGRWIVAQPWPGPADNQIRAVTMPDVDTIETQMMKEGIRWMPSDKSPGSRAVGLQLTRDRLEASTRWAREGDSKPGLFFMQNCTMTVATVPVLPRDEKKIDDVDTEAEDHLYDCLRYRVLAGSNRYVTDIQFLFPT